MTENNENIYTKCGIVSSNTNIIDGEYDASKVFISKYKNLLSV